MKIPVAHLERIQQLGYTEPEARFLYIVAVFSGYFTLSQFRAFTGSRCGKRPSAFAQKLIEQGHGRICGQARTASLFHLFSRKVYGPMDKDNLRNRRRHSSEFMRTRLVLLDFIMVNQELNYFESEQDKVDFFCGELGISKDCLPARVYEGTVANQRTIRYFVDKFPLFLDPPLPGVAPVVTFTYIDSGFDRWSSFASHLAQYSSLFGQLERFRFLYVATKEAYFTGIEERFRSIVRRPLESDLSDGIVRYFQIRKKWDNHEYIVPVTADLEFLRESRGRFQGNGIEALYKSWHSGELQEWELRAKLSEWKPERAIFFDTYLIRKSRVWRTEPVREGDRCMKDTDHQSDHRYGHRTNQGNIAER